MKLLLASACALGLLAAACAQATPPQAVPSPTALSPTPPPVAPQPTPPLPRSPAPPLPRSPAASGPDLASQLEAADQAFNKAQFSTAATLYEQVVKLSGDEETLTDATRLRAYARFRLGLSALLAKQEDRARQVLQEDFRDTFDGSFRQMSFLLWDTYAMTGDVATACARVTAFAQERGVTVTYGQGRIVQPDQICRVPRT